jgi:hypothetical protein
MKKANLKTLSILFYEEWFTANEGLGENPIYMSGSDLCIPRNETVQ